LLRGQDSNLQPNAYTYSHVSMRRGLYHHPAILRGARRCESLNLFPARGGELGCGLP